MCVCVLSCPNLRIREWSTKLAIHAGSHVALATMYTEYTTQGPSPGSLLAGLSLTLLPGCKCFISLEDTHPHYPWALAKVSLLSYRIWFGSHWSSWRYIWVSDFLKWSTKLNSATELLSLWFLLAKRGKSVITLKSHISFQPAISKELFLKKEATSLRSQG